MLYFQYVLIKFYADGMGKKEEGGKRKRGKILYIYVDDMSKRTFYIYVDDNNKIKLRQTCLPGLVINATDRFSTPF